MLTGWDPQATLQERGYRWWLGELEKNEGGIEKFAEGYKIFGWNRDDEKGTTIFKGVVLAEPALWNRLDNQKCWGVNELEP